MANKSYINRADLVRIWHQNGEDALIRSASILGYVKKDLHNTTTHPCEGSIIIDLSGFPAPQPGDSDTHESEEHREEKSRQIESEPAEAVTYYRCLKYKKQQEPQKQQPVLLDETYICQLSISGKRKEPPPIIPWPRLYNFIRHIFETVKPARHVNIRHVIKIISRGEPLSQIPYSSKKKWAKHAHLLLDLNPEHLALWTDIVNLEEKIKYWTGRKGRVTIHKFPQGPEKKTFKNIVYTEALPSAKTPVLLVSDCGCLRNNVMLQQQWSALGHLLKMRQCQTTALVFCPKDRWTAVAGKNWRMVCWDTDQRISKIAARRKTGSLYTTLINPTTDDSSDLSGTNKETLRARGIERMEKLLSVAVRAEIGIVRELQWELAEDELVDIATLADIWNRNGEKDTSAVMIDKDKKINYYAEFTKEQDHVKQHTASLLQKYHDSLSPLILLEEKILLSSLDPFVFSDFCKDLNDSIEQLVQGFLDCKKINLDEKKLLAWFYRSAERWPSVVWQWPPLSKLALIAWHYAGQRNGKKLPGNINEHAVQWFNTWISERKTEWLVLQQGSDLVLMEKTMAHERDRTNFRMGVAIGALTAKGPILLISKYDNEDSEKERVIHHIQDAGSDAKGKTIVNPKKCIISGIYEEITFDTIAKPTWAKTITRDHHGLYATKKDDSRTLCWFNPGTYQVRAHNTRGDISVEKGFWWDKAQYQQWQEHGFRKPAWADDWGVDEQGQLYAGFTLPGIQTQYLRWIWPGEFSMGSPDDEPERDAECEHQHTILLTRGFWLAETACTQQLWKKVMKKNASYFNGDFNPVEDVSWNECKKFFSRINSLKPELQLRLPTEAEWEYACRAGTTTPFSFGDIITTDQVNYDGNYPYHNGPRGKNREKTVPVKSFPCNAWGLYEMHGNVWEWCEDWYGEGYYKESPEIDPCGPETGVNRVLRGGSWGFNGWRCRSAFRCGRFPDWRFINGFRFAQGQ